MTKFFFFGGVFLPHNYLWICSLFSVLLALIFIRLNFISFNFRLNFTFFLLALILGLFGMLAPTVHFASLLLLNYRTIYIDDIFATILLPTFVIAFHFQLGVFGGCGSWSGGPTVRSDRTRRLQIRTRMRNRIRTGGPFANRVGFGILYGPIRIRPVSIPTALLSTPL